MYAVSNKKVKELPHCGGDARGKGFFKYTEIDDYLSLAAAGIKFY